MSGAAGALAVGLVVVAVLPGRRDPLGPVVLGLGAALLAVALASRGVGGAATPVEALLGASAGLLFALAFEVPAAVVALPLLVAGIDLAAVLAAGADSFVPGDDPDVLTLDLPLWGGGGDAARLGLLDAVFLALFAAWALRYDLRPRLVVTCLVLALVASALLGLALDRPVPALPFLAFAFLAPVLDRLPRLLRSEE